MLFDEIGFYKKNKKEFISLYDGKFLVIKGEQIIGVYDTRSRAYDEAVKLHAIGSFIIEHPVTLK
ncbi:MAG: hypothetical protein BGO69_18495 [Bacteroidetes bacterium 46-16]|nr:MAG: hypothetical protein BGO69_18495 [Bacteroidetes bacterium 46-16]